ncbi:MAG: lytic murein transglycosylase, partial [Alphaproteobacteria bacterium]
MPSPFRRLARPLLHLLAVGAVMAVAATPVQATSHYDVAAYQAWLAELRVEALAAGIAGATFDQALAGVTPLERVISADRNQPETVETHAGYIARRVDEVRIRLARERMAEHRALLDDVETTYGVQAKYIVALWGMESAFGRFTGEIPVIDALVTLAFDPRRARFFRRELLAALEVLDEGYIAQADFRGSWAGAVGQVQFLPSNFLAYAVDHDGDGRRDLWTSQADVFASAANFLANLGWQAGGEWGEEVRLPAGFD